MPTYVITEACIGRKDATCVDVCPAACIHTTPDAPQYYIDPDICIACEQCFFVCPVDAIYLDSEVPAHMQQYIEVNAAFFREHKAGPQQVTPEQAQTAIRAVLRHAEDAGHEVAVAVVDGSGAPVGQHTMDGASDEAQQAALNKAYTAALLQVATHQLGRGAQTPAFTKPEGFDDGRMTTGGGGYPIVDGATVVGAIGVAGAPNPQEDLECCQAGMTALRMAGGH